MSCWLGTFCGLSFFVQAVVFSCMLWWRILSGSLQYWPRISPASHSYPLKVPLSLCLVVWMWRRVILDQSRTSHLREFSVQTSWNSLCLHMAAFILISKQSGHYHQSLESKNILTAGLSMASKQQPWILFPDHVFPFRTVKVESLDDCSLIL